MQIVIFMFFIIAHDYGLDLIMHLGCITQSSTFTFILLMLKIPKNNKGHWGLQFEAQFNLIPSFETSAIFSLNFYVRFGINK